MNRTKLWLTTLALVLALAGAAQAQAPERKQITLGVGGKSALYYLPLTPSVISFFSGACACAAPASDSAKASVANSSFVLLMCFLPASS